MENEQKDVFVCWIDEDKKSFPFISKKDLREKNSKRSLTSKIL